VKRKKNQDTYFTMLIPPAPLREAFGHAVSPPPPSCEVIAPTNYHFTMNELQVPRKRSLRDLVERLGRVDFESFDVKISDADMFERMPRQNVLGNIAWLRPSGISSRAIQKLHQRIHMSLRPVGYPVGRAELRPHMTCLKLPFNNDARADEAKIEDWMRRVEAQDMPTWRVDKFHLIRSYYNGNRPAHEAQKVSLPFSAQSDAGDVGADSRFQVVATFNLK